MPAAMAVLLGILIGLVAGGSFRPLAAASIPGTWVLLPLFLVQAVVRGRVFGLAEARYVYPIWIGVSIALVVLCAAAWRIQGMALLAIGIALNLAVVLANGGMPVDTGVAALGAATFIENSAMYRLVDPGVITPWLGDVVVLEIFKVRFLLSAGDVALIIGSCTWVASTMLDARRKGSIPTGDSSIRIDSA